MSEQQRMESDEKDDKNWVRRLRQVLRGKRRGDVIVGTVGEEAQGVAIGKNIIQIGTVVIPTLPVLASVLLLALALTIYSLIPSPPREMTGEFNVAVAEFQVLGDGEASEDIYNLAQVFYGRLESEIESLGEKVDVIFEIREPVQTGPISGNTTEERAQRAEDLAKNIRANVVIYGTIAVKDSVICISPEFFVNVESFYEAEEMVGQYRMGASIDADSLTDPLSKMEINRRLSARSKALSLLVIGLSYYAKDDYENALAFFEAARDIEGWGEGEEVLYALLGYSALRQGLTSDAKNYCMQARDLNEEYSRAYICLGTVLYKQALGDPPAKSYEDINVSLLDEAIAVFLDAREAKEQPPGADVPTKVHLALGQAYLVKAQVADGDYLTQAAREFEAVIADYDNSGPNRKDRLQELASHAYAHRGLIYRLGGENQTAIPFYEQAVELTGTPERKALYSARLGDIYLVLGDKEKAILCYEEAVQYEPEGSDKRKEYEQKLDELRSDTGEASPARRSSPLFLM
jgi:tetratricopeptide (TPR) repeat protein